MNLGQVLMALRERSKLLTTVFVIVLLLQVVVGAFPSIVDRHHAHTAAEKIPGFWAVFGLVGVMLVFFISKAYGALGISRHEDYYDE